MKLSVGVIMEWTWVKFDVNAVDARDGEVEQLWMSAGLKRLQSKAGQGGHKQPLHFEEEKCGIGPTKKVKKRSFLPTFYSIVINRFLDAFSHLYKRVRPSVGQSVHPSVRPLVRPSHTSWNHAKVPFLTKTTISMSENASYAVYTPCQSVL